MNNGAPNAAAIGNTVAAGSGRVLRRTTTPPHEEYSAAADKRNALPQERVFNTRNDQWAACPPTHRTKVGMVTKQTVNV